MGAVPGTVQRGGVGGRLSRRPCRRSPAKVTSIDARCSGAGWLRSSGAPGLPPRPTSHPRLQKSTVGGGAADPPTEGPAQAQGCQPQARPCALPLPACAPPFVSSFPGPPGRYKGAGVDCSPVTSDHPPCVLIRVSSPAGGPGGPGGRSERPPFFTLLPQPRAGKRTERACARPHDRRGVQSDPSQPAPALGASGGLPVPRGVPAIVIRQLGPDCSVVTVSVSRVIRPSPVRQGPGECVDTLTPHAHFSPTLTCTLAHMHVHIHTLAPNSPPRSLTRNRTLTHTPPTLTHIFTLTPTHPAPTKLAGEGDNSFTSRSQMDSFYLGPEPEKRSLLQSFVVEIL